VEHEDAVLLQLFVTDVDEGLDDLLDVLLRDLLAASPMAFRISLFERGFVFFAVAAGFAMVVGSLGEGGER
jgi:hypothetical protein